MITVEKAKKLRAIIERAVAALELDNEAALECVELFPAWENGKAYTVETRVQYGGKLYRCVQAHTSQNDWTPPVAASLWSGVTVDPATPAMMNGNSRPALTTHTKRATAFSLMAPCMRALSTETHTPRRRTRRGGSSSNERGGLHGRARRQNHSAAGVSLVGEA